MVRLGLGNRGTASAMSNPSFFFNLTVSPSFPLTKLRMQLSNCHALGVKKEGKKGVLINEHREEEEERTERAETTPQQIRPRAGVVL